MRRPSNADAGADVPAAGGVEHERPELPCQQQLDHLHNVAKNLMLTAVVDEPGAAAVITDDNPHVAELCACVRTILEHGLIGLAAAQRLGLPAQAGSPTAWRVVRQSAPALHLPSAQSVAFVCGLSAVDDDAERLRLWLRHALNDSSLVDALDALLADERTMALWYSPGAAVRHADVKTVLLTALEALKGVGFRLSVTSGEWLPAATSAASLPGSFALSERRASGGTEEREAAGEGEEGADARARRARKPKRVAEIGKVPRAPAAAATAALAAAGGASAGGADAGAAALAGAAADDDAAAPAADALPASLSTADADAWIAAAPPPPPLSISLALKAAGAAPESLDTSGGLPEWVAAEKGVADSGASGGGASGSGAAAGGVAGGCVEEAGASVDGAGAPPPGPNVAVSASPSAGQAAPPPACLGSGPSGAAAAAESLAARGAHAALLSTADESGGAPRASAGAAPMPPLGEAGTARTQSKAVHTAAATGCVARPDSQSAAAPALEPAGPSGVTAARAPVPERPHAAVSPLAAAPRDEGRVAGAPAGALRRPAAQAIPPPLPVLTAPELAVPPASPAGVGSDAGGSEGAAQRTTPTPDSAHSRAAARSQLSRGGSSSAASDQGVLTCGGGGLLLDSIPAGASRSGALARVLIASEREEGIVLRVHESAHTLSEERDADLRRHRPHREGDEGGAAAAGSDIDLTAYLVGADGGAEGFSEWFGEAGAPRPRAAGSAASAAAPPAASPRAPPPPSAGRPPAVLILKVVGSCTRADGATRPHTLYRLECQLATECRTVLRRYSSFVGLHKQLCRAFPDAGLSRKWDLRLLRAKASMGEGKLAAAVVARRTQLLREYVADLMVLPGVPHSAPLAQFLGVRLGAGGGVALGSPLAEARGAAVPAGDILADGAGGGGGGAEPAADGGDNGRSVPAHAARATSQPEAEPAGRHIKLLLDPPAPRPSDGALLAAQRGRCAGCGARIGEPPSPGGDARARARSAAAAKRGAGSAAIASLTHSMSSSVSAARSTLGGLAGALVGAPRYCEYTRQLFCHGCHAGAERALPARLVHRWDGRPARVCEWAAQFLDVIQGQPLLCVSAHNPALFQTVPQLELLRRLRSEVHSLCLELRGVEPARRAQAALAVDAAMADAARASTSARAPPSAALGAGPGASPGLGVGWPAQRPSQPRAATGAEHASLTDGGSPLAAGARWGGAADDAGGESAAPLPTRVAQLMTNPELFSVAELLLIWRGAEAGTLLVLERAHRELTAQLFLQQPRSEPRAPGLAPPAWHAPAGSLPLDGSAQPLARAASTAAQGDGLEAGFAASVNESLREAEQLVSQLSAAMSSSAFDGGSAAAVAGSSVPTGVSAGGPETEGREEGDVDDDAVDAVLAEVIGGPR